MNSLKTYIFTTTVFWTIFLTATIYSYMKTTDARLEKLEHTKPTVPKIVNTFGELNDINPEHRAIVMAIAITESNGRYDVRHPTSDLKGIGGIKPSQWALKSNINSLKAIEEIVVLLEDEDKTPYEIIKFYKGGITNLKSTNQCFDLYQRLENIMH